MKLSIKAMTVAGGLLWGGAVLMVSLGNTIIPGYGQAFLEVLASIYPGFPVGGITGIIFGTVYALADGAVAGLCLSWLYNRLA